jgi:hypothetical protein
LSAQAVAHSVIEEDVLQQQWGLWRPRLLDVVKMVRDSVGCQALSESASNQLAACWMFSPWYYCTVMTAWQSPDLWHMITRCAELQANTITMLWVYNNKMFWAVFSLTAAWHTCHNLSWVQQSLGGTLLSKAFVVS